MATSVTAQAGGASRPLPSADPSPRPPAASSCRTPPPTPAPPNRWRTARRRRQRGELLAADGWRARCGTGTTMTSQPRGASPSTSVGAASTAWTTSTLRRRAAGRRGISASRPSARWSTGTRLASPDDRGGLRADAAIAGRRSRAGRRAGAVRGHQPARCVGRGDHHPVELVEVARQPARQRRRLVDDLGQRHDDRRAPRSSRSTSGAACSAGRVTTTRRPASGGRPAGLQLGSQRGRPGDGRAGRVVAERHGTAQRPPGRGVGEEPGQPAVGGVRADRQRAAGAELGQERPLGLDGVRASARGRSPPAAPRAVVGAALDGDAALAGRRHERVDVELLGDPSVSPRICSAATAITIAPPSGILPSRVWMLPRSSTKSRSGRACGELGAAAHRAAGHRRAGGRSASDGRPARRRRCAGR